MKQQNIKLLKRLVKWNKSLIGKSFFYYPDVVKADGLDEGQTVFVVSKDGDGVVTVSDRIDSDGIHFVVLLNDLTYNKV